MTSNKQFSHLLKITAMSDEEWINYIKGRRNLIDMCNWYEWQEVDFENALENDDFSSIDSESDPEYVKVRKANKVIAEKRRNCVQLVQPRPPLRVPRKQRRSKKEQTITKPRRVPRQKPRAQPKEVPYTANLYKKVIKFHHRSVSALKSKLEAPCSCPVQPVTSESNTVNALVERKRPQWEQFGRDLADKKLQEHYAGVSDEETVPAPSKKRARKSKRADNIDSQSMEAAVKAIEDYLRNKHSSDDTDFSDDQSDDSLLDTIKTDLQEFEDDGASQTSMPDDQLEGVNSSQAEYQLKFYKEHSNEYILPNISSNIPAAVEALNSSQTDLQQKFYEERSNEYILPTISSDIPATKEGLNSFQTDFQLKFYEENSNEFILPSISSDIPATKEGLNSFQTDLQQKFYEENSNEFILPKISSNSEGLNSAKPDSKDNFWSEHSNEYILPNIYSETGLSSVKSDSKENFWGEPPNSLLDFLGPQTSYTRAIKQEFPVTTSDSREFMAIYHQLENIEKDLKQDLKSVNEDLKDFK